MKKFVLAICLFAASFSSFANKGCNNLREIAETVMTARQDHVPKQVLVNAVQSQAVMDIIQVAWTYPIFPTLVEKNDAIRKFSTSVQGVCIKHSMKPV